MRRLLALGALALAPLAYGAGIPGQGTWESTLLPRDIDRDGVVDAYFDTTLNISWLADWNTFGALAPSAALTIVQRLNLHGITGWRLPLLTRVESEPWVDPAWLPELDHMHRVTLGNTWGMKNTGPFRNMVPFWYLAATDVNYAQFATFDMYTGGATLPNATQGPFFVAVRDGDVALVPEPATAALLLVGLAGLVAAGRKAGVTP